MNDPGTRASASTRWSHVARRVGIGAAVYALAGGALSFAGWALDLPRLTDWIGSGISIKANACLAVMATGLALLLYLLTPSAARVTTLLGTFTALLGGLTLLEHLTGWDLGIDTLLFDEPAGAAGTASPGRMGPPASTSFLALGIAVVLMSWAPRYRHIAVSLALGVLALSLLSLTGYWYGATAMYTVPRLTGIALQTATLLCASSAGIISANPSCQPAKTLIEESSAGLLARVFVPLAFVVPLVLGWLRLAGQKHELYDAPFGTALRSVIEVTILAALLWWSVQLVRTRNSESARVQEQLRRGERHLADLLESIADGFIAFDAQWRFTFANREALRLLGRSRSELEGGLMWDLFPHLVDTHLYSEFKRAMQERTMVEIEGRGIAADGRELSHRVYPAADGGLSVFFQDITARRKSEEILKEADRRKDEFLATLAHELRNPLAPIRQATAIADSDRATGTQRGWAYSVIRRQVEHMSLLLDDLLDVSRITRGTLSLRKQAVEVSSVVGVAVETARPLIDNRHHHLTIDLPEGLAAFVDPLRVSQIFANLLTNAAKYTPPGGNIRLAATTDGETLTVCVQDTGIGLSAEEMPLLFQMFSRGRSTHESAPDGLGIGLALTKGLVEMHGGTIHASSAGLGKGSTFTVRLPIGDLPHIEPHKSGARETRLAVSRRVLIADDNKDAAESLAMLLRIEGHQVVVAADGEAAIRLVEEHRPEVALLDIGMPGMNGYEVARHIRSRPDGAYVLLVAVTGWGLEKDRDASRAAGFDHHLVKPAEPNAVLQLLARMQTSSAASSGTGAR
jgi:PAS domain S-box-containing protein